MLGEGRGRTFFDIVRDKINILSNTQFIVFLREKLEFIREKLKGVKDRLLSGNKNPALAEGSIERN